ncbi:MAG: S-layer homology domain-containing protein, partial [Agathobaculum sp.]|uniref:S-layer homology domain-containing protein n=1 Tax=Agathobaculum sp. TaxID=2048138 RepID=UPI0025BB4212
KGQTVTITVTPEDGYTLDTLTVTDKDGNKLPVTAVGGGKYTFTMPEGAVSIAASFKAASAEGWKLGYQNCPLDETCPLWPYTDVKSSDWYHDGVHFCMENGLMNGYSDGSFKPAANTTRAMIATILYRLEGAPAVSGTAFSDVAAGAYYHDAVLWAQVNGVVKGYGDGTFGPDNAVTREQMAAILHRYAQYKGYDVSVGENTNILSYGDAERVEEYAIPAMQWACGAGVVTGKQGASGLNLDPKGSTTRAEMATMMMRFCAELVK